MKKLLKNTVTIFVLVLMSAMLVLCVSAKHSPRWVIEDMVRTTDEPGIRFSVKIDSALRNDEKLEEYGFIAIASKKLEEGGESISGFGLDCTLDYMRGVAYGVAEDGSRIDLLRKDDGAKATFSCVIHSIPVEHYKSGIVAKAYLIYDGEVYYSTAFKVNYLGAARNMKNGEEYENLDENAKKIIDDILAAEESEDDELIIIPGTGGEERDYEAELDELASSPAKLADSILIPTDIKEPEIVYDDGLGKDITFVYAYLDGEVKYVPIYTDALYPDILGDDGLTAQYNEKMCIYTVDSDGLYRIRSLGYNLDENGSYCGIEKEDTTVLMGSDENAVFYVDGIEKTDIYNIDGNRYDLGFDCSVLFNENTQIVIRVYNEDQDIYEYVLYDSQTFGGCGDIDVLSYVLYNNTSSNSLEYAAFVYGISDGEYAQNDKDSLRIVSNYDIGEDSDGNWRIYYEVYNPYTSMKEYDIPSVRCSEKAKELAEGLEAGTLVKICDGFIDDTNEEKILGIIEIPNVWSWVTAVDLDNGSMNVCSAAYDFCGLELERDIGDRSGFTDIYGNIYENETLVKLADDAKISVLKYSTPEDTFNWGVISSSSLEEIAEAHKSLRGYNEASVNDDGDYVTTYNKYVKCYVSVSGKESDGTPVADFVIVVVNGHETATEGTCCNWCAHEESVNKEAIVTSFDVMEDEQGKFRLYYDLYSPVTGISQRSIPSKEVYNTASSAANAAYSAGTIAIVSGGYVRKKVCDIGLDGLVWISGIGDDGVLSVVPFDCSLKCKDCIKEYVEGFDGEECTDIHGHSVNSVIDAGNAIFTAVLSSDFETLFSDPQFGSVRYEELSLYKCMNDKALDDDGNYYTGQSDYVKAYISANKGMSDESEAEYVLVAVNGNENAALDEKCEKHSPVIEEPDEEPDTEEKAATYAVISDSAVDVDESGKYRVYYDVCNLSEGEKQSGIPSVRFAESASELSDVLESGTIITMESEFIDDTNEDIIKGQISEDNLVWIANVKDDGTLVAAPYDGSYTCPECVLYYCMVRYVENNETGVMDMFGDKTDGNFFKLTEDTSVVKISYSEYSDDMFKYGSIEKKLVSDLSIRNKELLCYNDNAQKADGSYTTGYTRFKKAFVAVNEKNEAEVVIVVVNGGENSALGEYCERDEGYVGMIPDEWK